MSNETANQTDDVRGLQGFPRRNSIPRMVPAELAITEAMMAVEAAGADIRLTQAVVLLGQARDKVADYVDGVPPVAPAVPEALGGIICGPTVGCGQTIPFRREHRLGGDAFVTPEHCPHCGTRCGVTTLLDGISTAGGFAVTFPAVPAR